jgi:hypothetical protein
MSSIPEYILLHVRRMIAEGMPVKQVAFLNRIAPEVFEEEKKKL